MREPVYGCDRLSESVRALMGVRVKLKVSRGRNKSELVEGILENAYSNIFTVRKASGELHSFSYADIISRHIKFLR